MKPPARKRTRPDRNLSLEPPRPPSPSPTPSPWIRYWRVSEQRGLLKAMKTFSRIHGSNIDLDYAFVEKYVPNRSTEESQSVVEFLKDSVLSLASLKLNKRTLEEKTLRKPIEEWTSMASTVAGPDEEPITTAFSQMLMVSSTEPLTLRCCDPPQLHRPPTEPLVGRTVPLRPMPRMQIKVERPDPNAARPVSVFKSPGPPTGSGPATGPSPVNGVQVMNWKVPPPRQQLSTTAGSSPARTPTSQFAATSFQPDAAAKLLSSPQPAPKTVTVHDSPGSGSAAVGKTLITTPQQPSAQSPTAISAAISTAISTASTPKSNSSGPLASLSSSSATGQTPPPSRTDPPGSPKLPLSSPAAEFHAKFGRTSKYATEDSPRVYGVKSVVDFEKIYSYLSGLHQPTNEPWPLTPMESAIVLDLLMSLPEELPLLDGNKLHKHLIQVYQFLSSTAKSQMAAELLKELKDGLRSPDGKRTNCRQSATRTADGDCVTPGGDGSNLQPDGAESQSPGGGDLSGSSGGADELLFPALNPFVVPLRLLMRK